MKLKLVSAFLVISGCAVIETPVSDPALVPIAQPVIQAETPDDDAVFFVPAQPAPYAEILSSTYEDLSFGFANNLRSLEISRLSSNQELLPQLQPGLQASFNGNAEVGLTFRQVLFDGGTYRARYQSDDHGAILRQVELLQALNREASDEISVFLSFRQNLEREALLDDLSNHLERLLNLAEIRARGGIGTESDVSLFALRLYEIQTDAKIAHADAQADLAALGLELSDAEVDAVEFEFRETHLPLSVVAALAELQNAQSLFELAKRERNPQVVLDGQAGLDPLTGLPTSNFGLTIEAETISIGGNVAVQRAEEELRLAEFQLEREIREAERETTRLRTRIEAMNAQLDQTDELATHAQARFNSFTDRFQAGTAQLSEAAGLVQTLQSSLESSVTLKFEILNLQRQLAEQGGHFWDIPS